MAEERPCPLEQSREEGWRGGGVGFTWKWRMMVQMRPSVSLGLPSAISSFRMLTSFTCGGTRAHARLLKDPTAFSLLPLQAPRPGCSPAGASGSPRQSAHFAACGSASVPSPGAMGKGGSGQGPGEAGWVCVPSLPPSLKGAGEGQSKESPAWQTELGNDAWEKRLPRPHFCSPTPAIPTQLKHPGAILSLALQEKHTRPSSAPHWLPLRKRRNCQEAASEPPPPPWIPSAAPKAQGQGDSHNAKGPAAEDPVVRCTSLPSAVMGQAKLSEGTDRTRLLRKRGGGAHQPASSPAGTESSSRGAMQNQAGPLTRRKFRITSRSLG